MTDRFLPRLKARSCEPQLLNFNPYQVAEIRAIILDRLFSLEDTLSDNRSAGQNDAKKSDDQTKARVVPLMQKPAIELCARKVAAATGDLRKALDICRQTIEMVEMEAKKKERLERLQQQRRPNPTPLAEIRLGDLENRIAGGSLDRNTHARTLSNPSVAATGTAGQDGAGTGVGMTLQDAPKVTVEHVKRALASAFGSPMVLKIRSLNVHQKIVLLLLVDRIRVGKAGTDSQMGKIFDLYTSKCRASNKFGAVSRGEFQDLVSMLEVTGLVTLGKAKEERLRKIDLVPRDIEVLEAIKEQDILGAFVQPQLSAVSE
ncbi:AAA ATPase [Lunasporangiospora selenospora]|uniref:AAA ATPase n=1 Tax=Lunasporangiospora selenospora TaxID=979761 RepID=A0A9P6G4I6_9FUNG|nr:AAA ATPase [Lunasporangiospora selenospora]